MPKLIRKSPRVTGTFGLLYVRRHERLMQEVLASPSHLGAFARGEPLPAGYGAGLDERVVEYPWLLSRGLGKKVLDAGSTLNHGHILDAVRPVVEELVIVTLAPEPRAFPERSISYLFADLRDLPLRDGHFDCVVSLSTLEHVGMDNALYAAGPTARSGDPDHELMAAIRELRRVSKPGARLLATVPYGAREDHGWFRQFDAEGIQRLIDYSEPARSEVTVYRHTRGGWELSTLEEAAEERYHATVRGRPQAPDGAAAARAVACVEITF